MTPMLADCGGLQGPVKGRIMTPTRCWLTVVDSKAGEGPHHDPNPLLADCGGLQGP